jgi:hypothetical protein
VTLKTQAFTMTNQILNGIPGCSGALFLCMEGDPVLNASTIYPSGSTIPIHPRGCDPTMEPCFKPFVRVSLNAPMQTTMEADTFDATDFTIDPMPANLTVFPNGATCRTPTSPLHFCTTWDIHADWVENTTYTLTLPASLSVTTRHTQNAETFTLGTARTMVFTVGPEPAEPVVCPAND